MTQYIQVRASEQLKQFAASADPRDLDAMGMLPPGMVQLIAERGIVGTFPVKRVIDPCDTWPEGAIEILADGGSFFMQPSLCDFVE